MKSRLNLPLLLFSALSVSSTAAEIDPAMQATLGITTRELSSMSLEPTASVTATVLSTAPLVDLYRQSEGARSVLSFSSATLDRLRKLNAESALIAERDVQAAIAQVEADKLALLGIEDRIALDWGPTYRQKDPAERSIWVEKALTAGLTLVRLSTPITAQLSRPVSADLRLARGGGKIFHCIDITTATSVDPIYQALTFLGTIESGAENLPAGVLLSGGMKMEGPPAGGTFVESDRAVYYLGKTWIYRRTGDATFERVEIPTHSPVRGGWFIPQGSIENGDFVATGTQSLLAQETLAPGEDD